MPKTNAYYYRHIDKKYNEQNFIYLMNVVSHIAEKYQILVIYSIHPRNKKILKKEILKLFERLEVLDKGTVVIGVIIDKMLNKYLS